MQNSGPAGNPKAQGEQGAATALRPGRPCRSHGTAAFAEAYEHRATLGVEILLAERPFSSLAELVADTTAPCEHERHGNDKTDDLAGLVGAATASTIRVQQSKEENRPSP
jgi:hypothetical protein